MTTLRTALALGALVVALTGAASAQTPRVHVVRPGENLYRIALRYQMSVDEIKRLNGLADDRIRAGQRLVVEALPDSSRGGAPAGGGARPVAGPPVEEAAGRAPYRLPPAVPAPLAVLPDSGANRVYGMLRAGPDLSLYDVAFRFGIDPDTLYAMNPDLGVVLGEGGPLRVPARHAMRRYAVRAGDTLFGIASDQGTTVAALRAVNDLLSDVIAVGRELWIPSGASIPGRATLPPVADRGEAAEYPLRFAGRLMAGGRPYDPRRFTAAHPTLALGSIVLVTSQASRRSTFAEVADRMPVGTGRVAELSTAVVREIGGGAVEIRVIHRAGETP